MEARGQAQALSSGMLSASFKTGSPLSLESPIGLGRLAMSPGIPPPPQCALGFWAFREGPLAFKAGILLTELPPRLSSMSTWCHLRKIFYYVSDIPKSGEKNPKY